MWHSSEGRGASSELATPVDAAPTRWWNRPVRRTATLVVLASALLAAAIPAGSVGARVASKSCGQVAGVPIHAHDVSCRTARNVYRGDMSGTLDRPLVSSTVLGGRVYGGPNGNGWGSPHPRFIYNGGDASGSISDVHWSEWGGPVAHGRGRNPIFKPRGGYYRRPVLAQLKATDLGRCEGRPAYLRLLIREPRRPGGPLGPWRSWAGPQTICEPYGSAFGG